MANDGSEYAGRGFGYRLREATRQRGALCVGIDPHPGLLRDWGLADDPVGLARFAEAAVGALAGEVAVLKPQVAFFERFGSRGVAVLEEAVVRARSAGALVLLDVKRGDIGSTVAGYAAAYLEPSGPLAADAVTANPYLGVGALAPLVEAAHAHGGGVFVTARTSNPESATVQRARTGSGQSVAQHVVDEVVRLNDTVGAADGVGSVGVVVGATVSDRDLDLSRLNGPVLAPGMGVQGGTPADLAELFGPVSPTVVPAFSREVLAAGPDPAALRAAARGALARCVDG